jgi:hypothetical protein
MTVSKRWTYFCLVAAVAAAMVPLSGAARAFVIDNQSNTNSDGTAKFSDPDSKFSSNSAGKTTVRQGNTTIQFGPSQQPFSQRYDSSNFFNFNRPAGER